MGVFIIASEGDSKHYITVTEVGIERGLAVQWTPAGDTWRPSIKRIEDLEHSDELYTPVQAEEVDFGALLAMAGIR